jgi:hypothetical protein
MTFQERITAVLQVIGVDIKSLNQRIPNIVTIEVNLSATPLRGGIFIITGLTGLTIGKQIIINQAATNYTGKGTRIDESQMDTIIAKAFVESATTIKVYWRSERMVKGFYKFNYFIQN